MNNKIILGIIGVVIVAGIIFIAMRNNNHSQIAGKSGVYCSPDGTLTDTMPIQSHRSYCIKSDSKGKTYATNTPSEYSFMIVDDQGNTLKDFEITHTKPMHVIVARKDLKYFQHVHPEFDQTTGTFTLPDLTFPADGQYRIFADFAASGGQKDPMGMPLAITISEDVAAGTGYTPEALDSEERTKTFDDYQVTLSSDQLLVSGRPVMLMFNLTQGDKPVTDLQEYLGALGHSVILREGTLDFIHAHPMEDLRRPQTGEVGFMVTFPSAGKYKIFTQFQRGGEVFTTDFVVPVAQGETSDSMEDMMMPGMDHNMRMMQ